MQSTVLGGLQGSFGGPGGSCGGPEGSGGVLGRAGGVPGRFRGGSGGALEKVIFCLLEVNLSMVLANIDVFSFE